MPGAEAKVVSLEVMAVHLAGKQPVAVVGSSQSGSGGDPGFGDAAGGDLSLPSLVDEVPTYSSASSSNGQEGGGQAVRVVPPAVRHQAHSQVRNLLKAAVARAVRAVAAAQAAHRQAGR